MENSIAVQAGISPDRPAVVEPVESRSVAIQGARFEYLEGLRAYLALWVVVSHALEFTLFRSRLGTVGEILDGGYAVMGFMVLSGFVITHLLIAKAEPYGIYIIRRFMRLAPIFIVCMVLSWLTYDWLVHAAANLPWSEHSEFQAFAAKHALRQAQFEAYPLAHVIAHVSMLHGAVPEEWLPGASSTILAPGWSISLEWQFYLVAPFLLYLFRRGIHGWCIIALAILGGTILFKAGAFGTVTSAFLGISAKFLVLGMICRFALPALAQISIPLWPTMIATVLFIAMIIEEPLGLLPWAIAFIFVIHKVQGGQSAIGSALFGNPVTLALGKISYSIYLIHFVIQQVTAFWLVSYFPDVSETMTLLVLLATVPLTVGVSILLYRYVEKPGIMVGHLLVQRLIRRG